jgi:pimeloyl-ACP methyl ester carboxylesterase
MKHSTSRVSNFSVTEHFWDIPIDHKHGGETIKVFAREVTAAEPNAEARPWLVFLQGGPGFEATRPIGNFGWVARACKHYRVLLLDQRGTGLSTAVDASWLKSRGDVGPHAIADTLTHYRADGIVRDCEFIRRDLGVEQWSVLGQSFGGFCALHYLSVYPESLREAFFTGGLPPIGRSPDEVYRATYNRTIELNERYYERYPQDIERVSATLLGLNIFADPLPSGDRLTPNRFLTLGHALGMSTGFEEVHYLVERGIDFAGLRAIENAQRWDTNPIYQVLHESSYADGFATRWSAHRLREEFAEFALDRIERNEPVYFTCEHVYPWQLNDWQQLQPFREVAEILAEEAWPTLYDADVLSRNTVPSAAAIYVNDPYVVREFSLESAAAVNGLQTWITSDYEHDGLRVAGEAVLDQLFGLVHPTHG